MMNWKHTIGAAIFFCISSTSIIAQNIISGTVSNNLSGEPIPSVSVKEKGSNNATITNFDGKYSIEVPENAVIVFSSLGFETQEKKFSENVLNISLIPSSNELDEIVVVGYGSQNIKDLTGSLVSVKSKSFQKGAFSTPEALVVGKTPGVRITSNSGMPGAGSRIRIRGGSSLNASNDPLIVIDGLPSDGLGLLNPSDIESFTILKDASATAIYGSRAANGVILVTTKKGKASESFAVNFNYLRSTKRVNNRIDVLSTDQFRDLITEKGTSSQVARLATSDPNTYTDWQNEIYQTGTVNDYNIALSG